uniref:C-type lectin domain-containing protein n=1 Tax=Cyclopterus lumpus TaxID=8103 RepID=A0A8C2WEJ1_CYCLU
MSCLYSFPYVYVSSSSLPVLPSSQCPPDWLANGRSCYNVRRMGLTWSDAQHSCRGLAVGSHLADLKTVEDLLFISSHLLNLNLLLLWTGLNDQQKTY